jgi:membrane-bound lytic murein transglycosylase B
MNVGNLPRLLVVGAVSFAASCSVAQAGPCAADIDAMQARVDARLEAIAAAGRFAPQSIHADMSAQPTPHSVAAAEERLGELNQHLIRNIRRAMTRARAADAGGNERRCEKELARVQRALGP